MKERIIKNIIKSALKMAKNPIVFWTGGKDSTLMLWFILQVANPYEFTVVFLDSGDEFPEVYEFIKRYSTVWDLNVISFLYDAPTAKAAKINKVGAVQRAIGGLKADFTFVGIRRDEHETRSKETFFSPRKDHTRVHPILHLTEKDVWKITKKNEIPYCKLYDKGYRSLGEKSFTKPGGKKERSGRDAEKEKDMARLRALGYF